MSRKGFSDGFSASMSQEKKSNGSTPNSVHSLCWSVCSLDSGPSASSKILFLFSTDGDGWECDCTGTPSFCGSSFYDTEQLEFCFIFSNSTYKLFIPFRIAIFQCKTINLIVWLIWCTYLWCITFTFDLLWKTFFYNGKTKVDLLYLFVINSTSFWL